MLLANTLLITAIYGRRLFFFQLFMFVILYFVHKNKNLFSLKILKISILFLPLLFMFSNIYQSYRGLSPSALNRYQHGNFWDALTNADATITNLQERQAMWKFNYLIVSKQAEGDYPPYGAIAWQAIKNAIPRIFWPAKKIYDLDEMTANLYGLPVTDYPTNNFAMTQADFGCFSIIIFPLMIFAIVYSIGIISFLIKKHATLFLIVTGFLIKYFLSIEASYADSILLFRDIIVAIFCYFVGYLFLRLMKKRSIKPRHLTQPVA